MSAVYSGRRGLSFCEHVEDSGSHCYEDAVFDIPLKVSPVGKFLYPYPFSIITANVTE